VFLYLAQDGVFDTSDSLNYGSLTSGSTNAGTWQLNRVNTTNSITGIIQFECDLNPVFLNIGHSSSNYYRMVVTKVITANVLTIASNSNITALPFSSNCGATNLGGGIVAIIANQIVMSSGSQISADAAGFSGGFSGGTVVNSTYPCNGCPSCTTKNYACYSSGIGGQRGSSIAEFSEDPIIRGNCRGALANGGGGGNNHNSAGGGGANVCSNALSISWTGDGVSLVSFASFLLVLSSITSP